MQKNAIASIREITSDNRRRAAYTIEPQLGDNEEEMSGIDHSCV